MAEKSRRNVGQTEINDDKPNRCGNHKDHDKTADQKNDPRDERRSELPSRSDERCRKSTGKCAYRMGQQRWQVVQGRHLFRSCLQALCCSKVKALRCGNDRMTGFYNEHIDQASCYKPGKHGEYISYKRMHFIRFFRPKDNGNTV